MKIYYSHCMAIYGTRQEQRDIDTLTALGFEVVNPSSKEIEEAVKQLPSGEERMAFFERFSDECDAVAFRALPGGTIPGGVHKELGWFIQRNKPVIELPNFSLRPTLDHEQTRQYLRDVGQR